MSRKNWNNKEISFLKENYKQISYTDIAKKLNRTKNSVASKAHKIGLSKKHFQKSYDNMNINPNKFLNITDKYTSYYLGLLWADGWLHNKSYSVYLSTTYPDSKHYSKILSNIGKFNTYDRKRKDNWKKSRCFIFAIRDIYKFLVKNNYTNKIKGCKTIIQEIPENLQRYFMLGFIDGDGCFYFYDGKYKQRQFSICNEYNYNWSFEKELFDDLNIRYSIKKQKNNNQKSTQIRITNKQGIKNLGEYIYKDPSLGLPRKYEKYLKILNS